MGNDIKISDYILGLKNNVDEAKDLVDNALKVYSTTLENFNGDYLGGAEENIKEFSDKLKKYVKSISDFYDTAAKYMQYSYDELKAVDSELSNKIGGE